jgi:hypothetical protein
MAPRQQRPLRVTLELDPSSDPIAGQVEGEPFTGWLQLAAALQDLADGGDLDRGDDPPS